MPSNPEHRPGVMARTAEEREERRLLRNRNAQQRMYERVEEERRLEREKRDRQNGVYAAPRCISSTSSGDAICAGAT